MKIKKRAILDNGKELEVVLDSGGMGEPPRQVIRITNSGSDVSTILMSRKEWDEVKPFIDEQFGEMGR